MPEINYVWNGNNPIPNRLELARDVFDRACEFAREHGYSLVCVTVDRAGYISTEISASKKPPLDAQT